MSQDLFIKERGKLFGIAYRMLGSVSDAEDVLQDVHLSWIEQHPGTLDNPLGWLVTVVTRRCIDFQRSARFQREQYVGVWLPEPLLNADADFASTPDSMLELAEDLSLAFMHLLERLTAAERAVYILRQAFDWSYADIAKVLQVNEVYCRQLNKRAGTKLNREWLPPNDMEAAEPLLMSFLQSCLTGNHEDLLQCLHQDLVAYSDGGGKVVALLRPIYGPERVARFIRRIFQPHPNSLVRSTRINGEPGLLV